MSKLTNLLIAAAIPMVTKFVVKKIKARKGNKPTQPRILDQV